MSKQLIVVIVMLIASAETVSNVRAENPAIERFNSTVTFYLSFDHGLVAEMARGNAQPTRVEGEPEFRAGLWGKAMTFKLPRPDKPGSSLLWYSTLAGNVDLTKPGSLVLWTC